MLDTVILPLHVGVNAISNFEIDELSHFLVARADRMQAWCSWGRITPHVAPHVGKSECSTPTGRAEQFQVGDNQRVFRATF